MAKAKRKPQAAKVHTEGMKVFSRQDIDTHTEEVQRAKVTLGDETGEICFHAPTVADLRQFSSGRFQDLEKDEQMARMEGVIEAALCDEDGHLLYSNGEARYLPAKTFLAFFQIVSGQIATLDSDAGVASAGNV